MRRIKSNKKSKRETAPEEQREKAPVAASKQEAAPKDEQKEKAPPSNMFVAMNRSSSERKSSKTSEQARSLHQRSHSLSALYPATPISSYYALNLAILHAFDSLYQEKNYQVAYAMGLQFIETALLEIPRHGYFYSERHRHEREASSQQAERVCMLLEKVLGDEAQEEKSRLEHLAKLAREQRIATKPLPESDASWSDLSTVCSDAISSILCPIPEHEKQDGSPLVVPLIADEHRSKRQKEESLQKQKLDKNAVFEPLEQREEALVVDSRRPSSSVVDSWYDNDSLSAAESADLERALFLSGLDVRQQASFDATQERPPTKGPGEIDIAILKECFREDFQVVKNEGRVRISTIQTYQGRLVGSINGCTVIAPLVCIHHFQNDATWPDPGLPDAVLEHVMDEETPGLLPQVREELGLTKDALIIPSDVHDFLLERGLLMQEQFVTVIGGNIMDEVHLNEFVDSLTTVPSKFQGKRIAATVFFHEHVIAIIKLDRGGGQTWFDVIDSLPYEDTILACPSDFTGSISLDSADWMQEDYIPYAARIRCLDVDALRVTLRWYACSKFNEKDCAYIDNYKWEDDKSDFDPRVFQAFLWAEV